MTSISTDYSSCDKRKRMIARKRLTHSIKLWVLMAATMGGLLSFAFLWLRMASNDGFCLNSLLAAVCFYFLMLVSAGLAFFDFHRLMQSLMVRCVMFMLLFIWGCTLYFFNPVDRDYDAAVIRNNDVMLRAIESPNRVLGAFFPSRGGFEKVSDSSSELHYFIFHSSLIFYVTCLIFAIFGRGLFNRLKAVAFRKKLDVFWGCNEQGFILAESIMAETPDHTVLFRLPSSLNMDKEALRRTTDRIDSINCLWQLTDFSLDYAKGVSKWEACIGVNHFFVLDDGHDNVTQASRLLGLMKGIGGSPNKVFYVRLDASSKQRVYVNWCESVCKEHENVEPIILDEAELVSNDFISRFSRLQCGGKADENGYVQNGFKVLMVGLGDVGQAVLRKLACSGQLLMGPGDARTGLSIDVVDKSEDVLERFKYYHQGLECGVEGELDLNLLSAMDVSGIEYEDWLAGNLRKYNQIVFCLPEDSDNIELACKAERIAKAQRLDNLHICAKVKNADRRNYLRYDRIKCFGGFDNIYSWHDINMSKLDEIAMALNAKWCNSKLTYDEMTPEIKHDSWRTASFSDRNSSRASAQCEVNLLRLLGYEVYGDEISVDVTSAAEVHVSEVRSQIEKHIDVLGRNEHLRWNAYHALLFPGVARWDMENPPLSLETCLKPKQIDSFGKHACMVPYDSLPAVDYAFAKEANSRYGIDTEDASSMVDDARYDVYSAKDGKVVSQQCYQAKDREFCRLIPDNVLCLGCRIVKSRMKG